jgi:hypothetical protein
MFRPHRNSNPPGVWICITAHQQNTFATRERACDTSRIDHVDHDERSLAP